MSERSSREPADGENYLVISIPAETITNTGTDHLPLNDCTNGVLFNTQPEITFNRHNSILPTYNPQWDNTFVNNNHTGGALKATIACPDSNILFNPFTVDLDSSANPAAYLITPSPQEIKIFADPGDNNNHAHQKNWNWDTMPVQDGDLGRVPLDPGWDTSFGRNTREHNYASSGSTEMQFEECRELPNFSPFIAEATVEEQEIFPGTCSAVVTPGFQIEAIDASRQWNYWDGNGEFFDYAGWNAEYVGLAVSPPESEFVAVPLGFDDDVHAQVMPSQNQQPSCFIVSASRCAVRLNFDNFGTSGTSGGSSFVADPQMAVRGKV